MHITQEQIGLETRVDSNTNLVKELKTYCGVKGPKIILVFDEGDSDEHPWKIHVFYNSPTELQHRNGKVDPIGEEVIRAIYHGEHWEHGEHGEHVGWCGKIRGQSIWVP